MGVIRRFAVIIAVLAPISAAAACQDHAAHSPFFRSAWPPPSKAVKPAPTLPVNLCGLLHWSDLGYPGIDPGTPSPTQSGNQPGWQQYCQWQSYQWNAGFTPPALPGCAGKDTRDVNVALSCMNDAAGYLDVITANSSWVTVAIGWTPGSGESAAPYYTAPDGRKVYVNDQSANSTCIAVLLWAHGILETEVIDPTKAFGTPCDQTKKVVNLLITREPH